jgi:hypothetical protein
VLQAKRELVAVKQARLSLAQDEYRDDPPPLAVSYHITDSFNFLSSKLVFCFKIVFDLFSVPVSYPEMN